MTHGSAYDRSDAAWQKAQHARLHNRAKPSLICSSQPFESAVLKGSGA